MKTKSKIESQIKKKKNINLVRTIIAAKKNEKWLKVANILSSSRRNKETINLGKIDEESKQGEIIVVPGKVLSQGDVTKKIRVVALSFSEEAIKKLLKSKSEILSILEEIKKNPSAQGIKILTNTRK